jgi:hypothetical protein
LVVFSGSISASGISGERLDAARAASAAPVDRAAAQSETAAPAADNARPIEAADVTRRAVEMAFEHARIRDWAEAVRSADRPAAFLVARPDPDGRRPSYPSAIEAYRDIAELIGAL